MIKKIEKKTLLILSAGLILCIPVIIPYLHSGYFISHDGEWAVVRAAEMFREIKDLQFPPRYSSALNFGYGYPLFNFVYPSPYYLSFFLHLLGFGFINSIKFIFALSVLFSFLGMFLLSRKFWKNDASAMISSVLYIYLPYRLVDLFVRGSIGESISFALYPFIIFFSILILEKKTRNFSIILSSLLFAFLISAHNISSVYFGIIYLAFLIGVFFSKNKNSTILLFIPLIWGALISFYFWGVALFEKPNILLSKLPIAERNLYWISFQKLIYSPWGYGTPTDSNPFTYSLGIPQIIAFIASLFAVFKLKPTLEKSVSVSFFILSIIFIFMMFPASSFFWKLPLLSDINYPWTLLLPLGFLFCFLSGSIVGSKRFGVYLGGVLAVSSIILYISFARPSEFVNRGDDFYLTNEATTTSSNELMPVWVKIQPTERFENKVEGINPLNLVYKSNRIYFESDSRTDKTVQVNQIYYPGWIAQLDDSSTAVSYKNKHGLMNIEIPSGFHRVVLKFTETRLRMITDLISIAAFISLLSYAFALTVLNVYGKKSKKSKK